MTRYNKDALCPKCSADSWRVTTEYTVSEYLGERMRRKCTKCGADWYEDPLDKQEQPK